MDDEPDLEIPDSFAFTAIRYRVGCRGVQLWCKESGGIGAITELGYVNSIGKDLMANGRFNLGDDVRWTSFAKTFDVVG